MEHQLAGGRGPDAELVLLLADAEAGEITLHHECSNPLIPLSGIHRGKHDVEARLLGIRDPELLPVEHPAGAAGGGTTA